MSVGKIPESRSSQINSFKESGLSIQSGVRKITLRLLHCVTGLTRLRQKKIQDQMKKAG